MSQYIKLKTKNALGNDFYINFFVPVNPFTPTIDQGVESYHARCYAGDDDFDWYSALHYAGVQYPDRAFTTANDFTNYFSGKLEDFVGSYDAPVSGILFWNMAMVGTEMEKVAYVLGTPAYLENGNYIKINQATGGYNIISFFTAGGTLLFNLYNPSYFNTLTPLASFCLYTNEEGKVYAMGGVSSGITQASSPPDMWTSQTLAYYTYNFPNTGDFKYQDGGYTMANARLFWKNIILTTDPNANGGISGPGGGNTDFDDSSDAIDFPALPGISLADTGFLTMYKMELSDIKNFADYCWKPSLLDALNQWALQLLYENPIDMVMSLSLVPCDPSGTAGFIKIGPYTTTIDAKGLASQFEIVDCGSLNVKEYWGSYLDYSPYTKIQLYLPFIGIVSLDTDDIMGRTVQIKYYIDCLTGACTAYIKCGDSVRYAFNGMCAVTVPVNGRNFADAINALFKTAFSAASGLPASSSGNPPQIKTGEIQSGTGEKIFGLDTVQASNTVSQIMSAKPQVFRSGSLGGNAGFLGYRTPFFIVERPRQSLPANYNGFVGYPSNITSKLGDLSGFTSIETMHLVNTTATAEEKAEIEQLLQSGVIL